MRIKFPMFMKKNYMENEYDCLFEIDVNTSAQRQNNQIDAQR